MGRKAGVTAEQTKRQLIDAAADEFAAHGYEGARVAEIAKRAGLTTGAIYAHYGNKADLLNEAIRARGPGVLDGLLASDTQSSVLELIRELGISVGKGRRGDGALLVEAVGAARRDPDVERILRKNVAGRELELALLIQQAQKRGEIAEDLSPDVIARLCTTLAMGTLVVRALQLDRPHPDHWAEAIDRIISAISADTQPTGAPAPSDPSPK